MLTWGATPLRSFQHNIHRVSPNAPCGIPPPLHASLSAHQHPHHPASSTTQPVCLLWWWGTSPIPAVQWARHVSPHAMAPTPSVPGPLTALDTAPLPTTGEHPWQLECTLLSTSPLGWLSASPSNPALARARMWLATQLGCPHSGGAIRCRPIPLSKQGLASWEEAQPPAAQQQPHNSTTTALACGGDHPPPQTQPCLCMALPQRRLHMVHTAEHLLPPVPGMSAMGGRHRAQGPGPLAAGWHGRGGEGW